MDIEYSYTKEFEEIFDKLKKGEHYNDLLQLDGIKDKTDMVKFSKQFFSKKVTADVSVDSNSNVEDNSVIAYETESIKPLQRLNAYYLLYKYGKKLFDKETAEKMVEGQLYKDYYINDFHKFATMPYCYNFSCLDIVIQGLPFVKKIKSEPPKHLSSFMGQLIQFITYASNSIAGAVGLADFLICTSYFVDKLFKDNPNVPKEYLEKQVRQELQSFIYSVNQPFRNGTQSSFTNISLFDDEFLTKLCNEYLFPDGTQPNKETVKYLQKMYVDLHNETMRKTVFTFPVVTACFAVDDNKNIIDKDFLDFVAENNLEFGFMNIYAGKTSVLSSCCFDGSTWVYYKNNKDDDCILTSLEDAYEKSRGRIIYTIGGQGKYEKARVIKLPKENHKMYKITTNSLKELVCTDNHIHVTNKGFVDTTELIKDNSITLLYYNDEDNIVENVGIKSIEEVDIYGDFVYCFEMVDQEHPIFTLANGIITHNCRLRSDTDKMYVNSFGSGGTKIGSCSVTTLNLPRIAYTVKDKTEFIEKLKEKVKLIAKINFIKRYVVKKRIDNKNLPLYTLGFMDLSTQYLTCGINGVNEAVSILGYDILKKDGQLFVREILDTVNDINDKMEKELGEGVRLNCEQVPAESSSIKLASADKILGYNDKYDLYSNQFIPLITKADLLDRIKLQGMFDNLMTGGAICHLNIDTEIKDKNLIINLINHAVKSGVVYHAINYNIQVCSKGHVSVGKKDTCECGAKITDNYLRTVGFLTNTKNWHRVRREIDYPNRQFYQNI